MNCKPAKQNGATARSGMLLLLVLSILALFVVIGAFGIMLAMRARQTARAFASANISQAGSSTLARAQLDEALLRLIRGPSDIVLASGTFESLLEDKYGSSGASCTVTSLSGTTINGYFAAATGTITVSGLDTSNPAAIAGRVITFVPAAGDPTGPTSYRILCTGTASGTLLLANTKPSGPLRLPTVFPCEAVINGREFSGTSLTDKNEPYDAFDNRNPFLTWPVLQSSTVAQVQRASFQSLTTNPISVDNDGDGVPDGVWLDGFLLPQRSPNGGQLTFSVSYLVLDLDGRINLNAHGSFVRAQIPQDTTQYPKDPKTVPVGMGYGPADVDGALAVAGLAAGAGTNRWAILLQGGTVTQNALVSSTSQWRPTPLIDGTSQPGASQPGRYGLGSGAQPGGAAITGTNALNSDAWLLTGNSPTDLKAQLQVFTSGSGVDGKGDDLGGGAPTLTFARPSLVPWQTPVLDTADVLGSGTAAHPYRMRLDDDAPRAAGTIADDAVYTVAELERILRQFDSDAATLAPRLAAMLDDYAERSRMTVTTDSWDTPALTGTAAQAIAALTGTAVYSVHSPEVVAGLRFNLNRPLTSGSARQEYFRQLQSLLVALSVPADAAAQWAANVIEFRDPDSVMSQYVTASGTVWGAERPEMAISNATTDGSKITISLYRPWAAQCTGTNTIAAERIDPLLGNQAANTLNATGTAGGSPVWRVVAGGTTVPLATLISSATAVPVNTQVGTGSVTSSATQVLLQRLADPAKAVGAALDTGTGVNDYVTVDSVSVPPVPTRGTPSRWLHWPNRDLVSHGELLAVQSGSAANLPDVLFDSSKEASLARTYPAILDATIVPSRFTGANVSVANGATNLAGTGFENFQYGQFSRWREAGRVNVNTILPNTGNNPSTLDNAVWTALVGGTSAQNPVTSGGGYSPVQTLQTLLTGSTATAAGPFDRFGPDSASAFLKRSTAIRLANCATVRSHVFAVWITLRITDSSPNAGPPQYARLFAIVDRSVPVGYAPGRTLNVRDTIRLQRFLQ